MEKDELGYGLIATAVCLGMYAILGMHTTVVFGCSIVDNKNMLPEKVARISINNWKIVLIFAAGILCISGVILAVIGHGDTNKKPSKKRN